MSLLSAVAGSLNSPRVSLDALEDIIDVQVSSNSSASLIIESDGDIKLDTTSLGEQDMGDWITPKAAAGAAYEVQVTINSGSLTSGTTGSWLSLGSTQTWNATDNTGDASPVGADITVEIRRASGATLATKNITLSASYG